MKKGEKERESAVPATGQGQEARGENVQAVAQPAATEEQSVQERRRQAALRRLRQEEERRAREQKRVDEAYAAAFAVQLDPGTETPVHSEEDFLALAASLPLKQEGDRLLREELDLIGTLNTAIRSLEDVAAQEGSRELLALMEANPGLGLSQAYILTHFDKLAADMARRAARAAVSRLVGTRHLQPMPGRGEAGPAVPGATMEMYRSLFPGKSDAEFARHWKKARINE